MKQILDSSVDKAFNDFIKLVEKYADGVPSGRTTTLLGEKSGSKKGFYMLCIKRDETLPKNERLQMATLGQNMPLEDLGFAFEDILVSIDNSAKEKITYA